MLNLFICLWAKGKVVKNLPALALINAIQPCGRRDALALSQGRENKQDTDASAAAGLSTRFTTATQASELYELTCCHCCLPTAPSASCHRPFDVAVYCKVKRRPTATNAIWTEVVLFHLKLPQSTRKELPEFRRCPTQQQSIGRKVLCNRSQSLSNIRVVDCDILYIAASLCRL